MKKRAIALLLAGVLTLSNGVSAFAVDSPRGGATEQLAAVATYNYVTAQEALDQVKKGNVILLDVRSKKVYDKKHIKGSINIPYSLSNAEANMAALQEFVNKELQDNTKLVYIICFGGSSYAPPAADDLEKILGSKERLFILKGGFNGIGADVGFEYVEQGQTQPEQPKPDKPQQQPILTKVTTADTSIPAKDGKVKVAVTGIYLPNQLYYRVRGFNPYPETLVDWTKISYSGKNEGEIIISIPENKSVEQRKLKIDVNVKAVKDGAVGTSYIDQEAASTQQPGTSENAMEVKVVDKDTKKPLASKVTMEVYDYDSKALKGTFDTDSNGVAKYSLDTLAKDGMFEVKAKADGYSFHPNTFIYHLENGKIKKITASTIAGEVQTGDVVFEAIKRGGSTEPEAITPSEKVLVIKVVDKAGNPVTDSKCGLAAVNPSYVGTGGQFLVPNKDGKIKVEFFYSDQTEAIVKIHPTCTDYVSVPADRECKITLDNSVIKTINGKPYDGKTELTFVVDKNVIGGETTEEAPIASVSVTPNNLQTAGGKVDLMVSGKKLANELGESVLKVSVWKNNVETNIKAVPVKSSLDPKFIQEFVIDFPANEEATAQEYEIRCAANANPQHVKVAKVTVAGKNAGGQAEGSLLITEATVNPQKLSVQGGDVQLQIQGKNITADNWTVKAEGYLEGTEIKRAEATVSNKTKDGATLTMPKNPIKTNRIEWRIQVGVEVDGVFEAQKTVNLYQDKNIDTEKVAITEAAQPDNRTVVVTFEKNVLPNDISKEELGQLIHFDYVKTINGEKPQNREYAIGANAKVVADKNIVTITLADDVELSGSSKVYFDQGALKTENNVVVAEISWTITSKAAITSVDYVKDVFDHKGGKAVAKLTGIRLDEIDFNNPKQFEATITNPDSREVFSIPITINTTGEKPELSFDVPANTTAKTQSYLLGIKLNGVAVHEGTSENLAKRAVISVLPEGKKLTDTTLGGLTIAGNNSEGEDPKKISVNVEKMEGQLKIVLRLAGTNFDPTVTEVRAIDENGVIWPVSHVPE